MLSDFSLCEESSSMAPKNDKEAGSLIFYVLSCFICGYFSFEIIFFLCNIIEYKIQKLFLFLIFYM